MNDWFREISACPMCKSPLDWENLSSEDHKLKDLLFVHCTQCKAKYPIWYDRPLLMSKDCLKHWVPPIYEALHRKERHSIYESVSWLSSMIREYGLEECLTWIQQDPEQFQNPDDWHTILKEFEADIRLRKSGEWFYEEEHRLRALETPTIPIPVAVDQHSLFDKFVYMTLQARPKRLLDVASGSASNLSRTLGLGADVEFAVGTDRELKCLWVAEYKLAHIGKRNVSEPIGANVRQLPFADGVFDYATTWNAFTEICGIEKMLQEVFRVLAPDGGFQVSYRSSAKIGEHNESELARISGELAEHTDLTSSEIENIVANLKDISREDYGEFARLADIFIDEEDFLQRAERTGFRIECVVHHRSGTDDSFIAVLRRSSY